MISIKINNIKFLVNETYTIYQACDLFKFKVPRFCYHENLISSGNCRMCLVEIKNVLKPIVSCTTQVTQNIEIYTNTPLVQKAQENILEMTLLNHPLDCPICDQASECDLQNLSDIYGSYNTRYFFNKTKIEDFKNSFVIKTVMDRCIHCTKCIRFFDDIGYQKMGMLNRGKYSEIGTYYNNSILNIFSGNVIDLCPVGALTAKHYNFKFRKWEFKKIFSIDILDSFGANIIIHLRGLEVLRILPQFNKKLNQNYILDFTRYSYDIFKTSNYSNIKFPLLYKKNKKLKLLWKDAFLTFKNQLKKNGNNIKSFLGVCGEYTDFQTMYMSKILFTKLGYNSLYYYNYKTSFNNINITFRSLYKYNLDFNKLKNYKLFFFYNIDLENKLPLLNLHFRKYSIKGDITIFNIGYSNFKNKYPLIHFSINFKKILKLFNGRHLFCRYIKYNILTNLFLVNISMSNRKDNLYIINTLERLKLKYNLINYNCNDIGALDINYNLGHNSFLNYKKKKKFFKDTNIYYLINYDLKQFLKTYTNNFKNCNKKNFFIVYQNAYINKNFINKIVKKYNLNLLILPVKKIYEDSNIFVNFQGVLQKSNYIYKYTNKKENNLKHNFFILNKLLDYLVINDFRNVYKLEMLDCYEFFLKLNSTFKVYNNFKNDTNKLLLKYYKNYKKSYNILYYQSKIISKYLSMLNNDRLNFN